MMAVLDGVSLFETETAVVSRPVGVGFDRYGAPVQGVETEAVSGVLFCPGGTADLEATRPLGARVDATIHFPKGYGRSLKGCTVKCAGRSWRVVGDPCAYMDANTPGAFSMAVEVEAVDG